jgi:hypothetical protein
MRHVSISSQSIVPPDDPYGELLSRTRALRREQQLARDHWFLGLELDAKEDILFELEVLLKASACFANPRNHPGLIRRAPIVAQDFREATLLCREGLARAVDLTRQLLGARERTYVFFRYLETVLPEDMARSRLMREGTRQNTPDDSLIALRHGLSSLGEVMDGLLRAQRVPFRLFYAALTTVQREVEHNVFFNPLSALEFRPEFDRIRSSKVLELGRGAAAGPARRLVALTFLSLFRMLRYLSLLNRIAADPHGRRRRLAGRAYLVLSVLRSDARALSDYLRRHAAHFLAEDFEREIFRAPARELTRRADALRDNAEQLRRIQGAFDAIGHNIALEMRRVFSHDLPALDGGASEAKLRLALRSAVSTLRPALENAILFLGKALGADLQAPAVFDDPAAPRETSDRLRRDVWMFAQIARAFATKAENTAHADSWHGKASTQYVRDFLGYFYAIGYPLMYTTDYPRLTELEGALEGIRNPDLLDPGRLSAAVSECRAFHEFLTQAMDKISERVVLANVPFDRRGTARALRLYLGAF